MKRRLPLLLLQMIYRQSFRHILALSILMQKSSIQKFSSQSKNPTIVSVRPSRLQIRTTSLSTISVIFALTMKALTNRMSGFRICCPFSSMVLRPLNLMDTGTTIWLTKNTLVSQSAYILFFTHIRHKTDFAQKSHNVQFRRLFKEKDLLRVCTLFYTIITYRTNPTAFRSLWKMQLRKCRKSKIFVILVLQQHIQVDSRVQNLLLSLKML